MTFFFFVEILKYNYSKCRNIICNCGRLTLLLTLSVIAKQPCNLQLFARSARKYANSDLCLQHKYYIM